MLKLFQIFKKKNKLPELIMLVGIPGSGKSGYARVLRQFCNASVYSSDEFRKKLHAFGEIDGKDTKADNAKVFNAMHESIMNRLKSPIPTRVVYDATNISSKRRKEFLDYLRDNNVNCIKRCVFFAIPLSVCKVRNAQRESKVPNKVINSMHNRLEIPLSSEGWDEIRFVDLDEQ